MTLSFIDRRSVFGVCLAVAAALALSGCGANVTATFPNRLEGAEGQRFVVEDIEAIVNDPDLDDEGRREALRNLGIEDEALIDALLGL